MYTQAIYNINFLHDLIRSELYSDGIRLNYKFKLFFPIQLVQNPIKLIWTWICPSLLRESLKMRKTL